MKREWTVSELVNKLRESPDGRTMLRAIWQRLSIQPEDATDTDTPKYRYHLRQAVRGL